MEQEKSLQLAKRADETLWGKALTNVGRIFYSSNFSIYTFLIARKRKAVAKAYNAYANINNVTDSAKRDEIAAKYKKTYDSYISTIDKYITESIYTKVQKRAATVVEEQIMSKYYAVNKFKGEDEVEHRIRLEMLALNIDWENVQTSKSDNFVQKYKAFFVFNLEELYKAQIRHNAIILANSKQGDRDQYEAIYSIIDNYIKEALPILPETEKNIGILKDYKKYVAAIDSYEQKDFLELRKRLLLLGFSKSLFEYSFPAVAQEQCYVEIIEIARRLIANYYTEADKYAAYEVLLDAIEEYADNVLAYKVYWLSEQEKQEYKEFDEKWQVMKKLARIDFDCYLRKREILFIEYDKKAMKRAGINIQEINEYYKERLIIRGTIRRFKSKPNLMAGKFVSAKTKAIDSKAKTMEVATSPAITQNASDALFEMVRDSYSHIGSMLLSNEVSEEEVLNKLGVIDSIEQKIVDGITNDNEISAVTVIMGQSALSKMIKESASSYEKDLMTKFEKTINTQKEEVIAKEPVTNTNDSEGFVEVKNVYYASNTLKALFDIKTDDLQNSINGLSKAYYLPTSINSTVIDSAQNDWEVAEAFEPAKAKDLVYAESKVADDAKSILKQMINESKKDTNVDFVENIVNDVQTIVNRQYQEYSIKVERAQREAAKEQPQESTFNIVDFVMRSTRNLKKKRKARI